jgi:hypothetical protein
MSLRRIAPHADLPRRHAHRKRVPDFLPGPFSRPGAFGQDRQEDLGVGDEVLDLVVKLTVAAR